jgi:hypothetical protein
LNTRADASEGRLATWADIAAGSQLDLELTESMIMDDVDENVSKLAAIRDMRSSSI